MRYVKPILWALAFLWVLPPLLMAGDFISSYHLRGGHESQAYDDDAYVLWFLLGVPLALVWLVRTIWTILAMMRLLPRRAEWEALGALALEAALVASGLGVCATDVPIHLRLTVSEPALNVLMEGQGGEMLAELCQIEGVERRDDMIRLKTGAGYLVYSPGVEPSIADLGWGKITHLRGPWYRFVWGTI